MNRRNLYSFFVAAALMCGSAAALGQFSSQGVSLKYNLTNATAGATSGNGCWGYVSPSGRQYVIMGFNNKAAFVEVTNPNAPVYFATISHISSSWADIKVHQDVAYLVTEAVGSGLQVIDLANIDNHQVTLVRTITSPGRTHTIHVNNASGYLYTCGSRNGTGTTMCFNLANPRNPVQVGPASMTTQYQHEGLAISYTSGPYAGKEIWFGFSESRGIDVYDFTNKNLPVQIGSGTYPDMRYCHQGWVSADLKYLYVNDELDEPNISSITRSLIFDIEDPANPVFLGTFSTGLTSIDHNEYWADGFVFQSNYTTGLRIFDAENPLVPVQVGYFDTYPANNGSSFNGAWSNYPYLPNGVVAISDINRGLFVVDPTDAVTRTRTPQSYSVPVGRTVSGNVGGLGSSDNVYLHLANDNTQDLDDFPIHLVVSGKAYDLNPLKIRVQAETATIETPFTQVIELFNWNTNDFEAIDSRPVTMTDTVVTASAAGNLSRFVNPTTKDIQVRIKWVPLGADLLDFFVNIDEVNLLVTR